jgi:putative ABC transport system permease protein
MKYFLQSANIALQNIKTNPLHTLLSTLGIIIGVAALVGILALGDGLEKAGRNQLSKTTSVQSFTVTSNSRMELNGINVAIKNRPKITYDQAREIESIFLDRAVTEYVSVRTIESTVEDSVLGVYLHGSMENALELLPEAEMSSGRFFSNADIQNRNKVMIVNTNFSKSFPDSNKVPIGRKVLVGDHEYEIIGTLDLALEGPRALIPITLFDERGDAFPAITMKVYNVENIPSIKEEMSVWLDENFEQGSEAFSLLSDEYWVEQLSEGILLFKLIMGAITGISIIVGGIGIMNVLLISVTERTKEIGIRKATGAKKKDIVYQFMAESVTISLVGSVLGWAVGMIGVLAFVPLVNKLVNIEFFVVINPLSVLLILILAIVIGVTFGTYPAWRASQLDPIDAIRHE